ncbi:velvet factor-domain-containing protein [Cantharellus anzutake]|uniref:velvet factor-domain-containing protein n=1 Tax=Cantharellus anzutake TaxID=1750568 RepID=UPI001904A3EC|nr:velvet factor-domain-containing protein [Cantharellus anzutake]KAF8336330.1 velvet factor-domain-containing protein [Cantharellus anzutake]
MQDETCVGRFVRYDCGPLAGRVIRAELHEFQKPDMGRKFAKRDRRPLDPPPVIRLRMFELLNPGLPSEQEAELPAEYADTYTPIPFDIAALTISSSDIDVSGLIAHIDLFPVPPPTEGQPAPSFPPPPVSVDLGFLGPSALSPRPSSPTGSVFGSSFVHAVHMDWRGEPVIFFVFSDVSVRQEGYFCLRYRFFDLFSRTAGSSDVPIAAELYSGGFVVHSTKDFPGLQPSTPLTKHLSRWGVRVNLREGDRRRAAGDSSDDDDSRDRSANSRKTLKNARPPTR